MSNTERIKLAQAQDIAYQFCPLLSGLGEITVAGSIRRELRTVGDIEIVALPNNPAQLLARLDSLVIAGVINKAVYSNGTHRWGDKYRGFVFQATRFEIFIADAHNYGATLWLRTGPGDANQFMMEQSYKTPFRARDGYWWYSDRKLSLPSEAAFFAMWGLPVIPPHNRTMTTYQYALARRGKSECTFVDTPPTQIQKSLF